MLIASLLLLAAVPVMPMVELPRHQLVQMLADQQSLISELQASVAELTTEKALLQDKIAMLETANLADAASVSSRLLRMEVSRIMRAAEKRAKEEVAAPEDENIASPKYIDIVTKEVRETGEVEEVVRVLIRCSGPCFTAASHSAGERAARLAWSPARGHSHLPLSHIPGFPTPCLQLLQAAVEIRDLTHEEKLDDQCLWVAVRGVREGGGAAIGVVLVCEANFNPLTLLLTSLFICSTLFHPAASCA